jgi:hypothetical protein
MHKVKVALFVLLGALGVVGVPAALAAFTSKTPLAKREMPSAQTQVAWYAADASNLPDAWDRAAEAYEGELAHCKEKCTRDAFRIVLARRYAMDASWDPPAPGTTPVEMPARVKAVLAAIDKYEAIAPNAPDAMRSEVVRYDILTAYRQPGAKYKFQHVAAR